MGHAPIESAPRINTATNSGGRASHVTFASLPFTPGSVAPHTSMSGPTVVQLDGWGDLPEGVQPLAKLLRSRLKVGGDGGSATLIGTQDIAFGDGLEAFREMVENRSEYINQKGNANVAFVSQAWVGWAEAVVLVGTTENGQFNSPRLSIFTDGTKLSSTRSFLDAARDELGSERVPANPSDERQREHTAVDVHVAVPDLPEFTLSPIATIEKQTGSSAHNAGRVEFVVANPYYDDSSGLMDSLESLVNGQDKARYRDVCRIAAGPELVRAHSDPAMTAQMNGSDSDTDTYRIREYELTELPAAGTRFSPTNVEVTIEPVG